MIAIGIFLYDRYIRRYIRFNLLRKVNGMYYLIHSKKLGMKKEVYTFDKFSYPIDFTFSINDQRNRPIIYYETSSIKPVVIGGLPDDFKFNPINLKRILRSNLLTKLFGATKESFYMIIIIVLVVTIVAVAVYGNYQNGQLNDKLIKIVNSTRPIYY